MFKVILIAVCVTIAGLFIMTKIDPSNATTSSGTNANSTYVSDDSVKVLITGEVLHTGDYYILPTGTLGQLINMAGGTTEDADSSSYNTSVLIGTHTSFYISPKTEIPSNCVVSEIEKVNINTADAATLISIGFSSSQASGIVAYRSQNGYFETLEDIMKVSGIGEKTYLSMRDKIKIS